MKKIIAIILVVLSVYAYWQVKEWIAQSGPLLSVVNVVVPKGASLNMVAAKLEEAQVIDKAWLFKIMARVNGLAKHLKEGLTSGQIMYLIATYPGLEGEIDIDVKEGELLPETYSFELGASRNSIILQAKAAMQKTLEEAWAARDGDLPIKNITDLLTMASIIEKETGIADERPLVASVFLNRLRKGMRLQTDPTVIYAITEGETSFGRSLKKKDLKIDSPYNTYLNYGLPPGPICNPGREAIMAAAHPAESDYLYFVADGKGGHRFAKSLSEHNRNVKTWVRSIRK